MKEETVKRKVREILEYAGCWYCMPAQNGFGRNGIPDFVGCYEGRFFAIECKGTGGSLRPLQRVEMALIFEAGGTTFLATPDTTDNEVRVWLRRLGS